MYFEPDRKLRIMCRMPNEDVIHSYVLPPRLPLYLQQIIIIINLRTIGRTNILSLSVMNGSILNCTASTTNYEAGMSGQLNTPRFIKRSPHVNIF